MPRTAIVTDSTANLSPAYVLEHNIHVVPLNIHWGEEAFKDGIDITPTEFYERLVKSSIHSKTSQPSMKYFLDVFEELAPGFRSEPGHRLPRWTRYSWMCNLFSIGLFQPAHRTS